MLNGYNNQNSNGHIDPSIQQQDFDKLSTRSLPTQRANNQMDPASLPPPVPDYSEPRANQQMPGFPGQFMNGPASLNPNQFSNAPMPVAILKWVGISQSWLIHEWTCVSQSQSILECTRAC